MERELLDADVAALAARLEADPAAATESVGELAPLTLLLRRSEGAVADVRECARLLLDAGADPNSATVEWGGEGIMSALFDAVERGDIELVALLIQRGATPDEDAFYPAYDLLREHGAVAVLDPVDAAVLAVARGESVQLPSAPPPSLGNPRSDDYGWILGQFALLGRTDVVGALIDSGIDVDTRGWSNFTPLEQAAMHGRAETVRLLLERGADVDDHAFEEEDGPTPLDCALWGIDNNRADDGDYAGTVDALLSAGAQTRYTGSTGLTDVDAVLAPTVRRTRGRRSASPARASAAAYADNHASVSAQNSNPSARSETKESPNCGSRLLKNTAIFGLPRLLRRPCRSSRPREWGVSRSA